MKKKKEQEGEIRVEEGILGDFSQMAVHAVGRVSFGSVHVRCSDTAPRSQSYEQSDINFTFNQGA
jgi:hypothetical protein